jgi:hypothetical protein
MCLVGTCHTPAYSCGVSTKLIRTPPLSRWDSVWGFVRDGPRVAPCVSQGRYITTVDGITYLLGREEGQESAGTEEEPLGPLEDLLSV